MRINHNISATTAHGSLFRANRDLNKSLERLSTGLRINRAADDAAGLGVSEQLRTQVRGMGQALRNTQDAIALLSTADGALNEQSEILQRMREIVIQARNDTLTDTERGYLFQEFRANLDELDRIAMATNYNGMRIFAAPVANGLRVYAGNTAGDPDQLRRGSNIYQNASDGIFGANERSSANHFTMMIGQNYSTEDAAAYNDTTTPGYDSWEKSASNMLTIQFGQMDVHGIFNPGPENGNIKLYLDNFDYNPADNEDMLIDWAKDGVVQGGDHLQEKFELFLNLIDGETLPANYALLFGGGRTVLNTTGLKRISEMRATIGATINRLEHSMNNLINQQTNTQHAESLIRDQDLAAETAAFTKNQILTRSSTSVLAQANMIPQSVLGLL